MHRSTPFLRFSLAALLTAGFLLNGSGFAQTNPAAVPDAQVEANVLKALAGAPELADQSITSTTVYGTVTLNGTVRDEPSRDLAEHVVANTAGVQKVVDRLAISNTPAPASDSQQAGTNPNLQSDGTVAPPAAESAGSESAPQAAPPQQGHIRSRGNIRLLRRNRGNILHSKRGQYPPPYGQPPYRRPYPPQYAQPYVPQKGGDAVVVPSGSIVQVRINQGMNSKNTVKGASFDGVVLENVFSGNVIAIPRGASFQGTVVDVHTAGQFKGKGELKLQLHQRHVRGEDLSHCDRFLVAPRC